MLARLKRFLHAIVPDAAFGLYHKTLAKYAARKFNHPSHSMVVIGVTGTKGKSTTSNAIWHTLTSAGHKVGLATTVNFAIGDKKWLNDKKMTMLGRTQLQELLHDMKEAGCRYAIVETSSEGIKQFRHLGVEYDVAVFTNLYPEHLDAHGSFEAYKRAKQELFFHTSKTARKVIDGKTVHKAVVINADAEGSAEMNEASQVETRILWTQSDSTHSKLPVNLEVKNLQSSAQGLTFTIGGYEFTSPLIGEWNIENVVSAIGVGITQGMTYPELQKAVATMPQVPGRMERVDAGQDYTVVVDYAYEPKSLELVYSFLRKQLGPENRLITLISSTGGGRDVWRRKANGETAAKLADLVIVTDEDPYDDDPMVIMKEVYAGAQAGGKVESETLWLIPDRKQAIKQAVALANTGDIILLPAKGAEQKMCLANGKKIDWDDRSIAREAIVAKSAG